MSFRRIGILGGTFDPIHWGHLEAAFAAETALKLMRLLVITSHVPPHRVAPRASAFHRFAMVSLAVSGRSGWRAADLELRLNAESYTADTLRRFHERGYAPAELFFIIGADAFADIQSWKDYPEVLEYAHFLVVSRPGFPVGDLSHRLPMLAERMVTPPLANVGRGDARRRGVDEHDHGVQIADLVEGRRHHPLRQHRQPVRQVADGKPGP